MARPERMDSVMREIVKTDKYGTSRHLIPDDAEVIRESGRALLLRKPLPKKRRWSIQRFTTECSCPYACLAAYEPCEFVADPHEYWCNDTGIA